MKKLALLLVIATLVTLGSCKKTETPAAETPATDVAASADVVTPTEPVTPEGEVLVNPSAPEGSTPAPTTADSTTTVEAPPMVAPPVDGTATAEGTVN